MEWQIADSLSSYDGDLTPIDIGALYKKIESTVHLILRAAHKDAQRQQFDIKQDRINMACPYCGDSKKSNTVKRGWIFFRDFNYKCWNGGCRKSFTSFVNMLVDFGQYSAYEPHEIAYIQQASDKSVDNPMTLFSGQGGSGAKSNDINDLKNIDSYAINRELIMQRLRIVEIEENQEAYDYLKSRNQIRRDNRHLGYSKLNNAIAVLNLTADRTKVIGIQLRLMKPRNGQRFSTISYPEMIRKWLGIETADEQILYKMERICLLYNILSVNLTTNPTIFEAAFDSHHFYNSMATLSASTKINLPNGLYFYDNTILDDAGRKESIKMLKQGHKVFLWARFMEDYPNFRNCKDLDDIIRTGRKFDILELYKYFSNDLLDMIYL